MLNIGLIILISIDSIVLLSVKVKFFFHAFKVFNFQDFFDIFQSNRSIKAEEKKIDVSKQTNIESYKKEIKLILKIKNIVRLGTVFILKLVGAIILIAIGLAIILLFLGMATASIWGTILFAIFKGSIYAVVFLLGIRFFYFLIGFWVSKHSKIGKKQTQKALIMDAIQFSMLSLLLYLAVFGYPININNIIVKTFQWDIVLNNLVSITLPMIFYSLIITNILALMVRVMNIFTKDHNKHKVIRVHQLLFIFIASCFFGIVYLTDIDFSFMTELERDMYLNTLEVVKWIITSAFIPLFLYTLNNFKKEKPLINRYARRIRRHRM